MAQQSALDECLAAAALAIRRTINIETIFTEGTIASKAFEAFLVKKITAPINHHAASCLVALVARRSVQLWRDVVSIVCGSFSLSCSI